jgi:glycosyltransferase involved in cell wall biosynthesis
MKVAILSPYPTRQFQEELECPQLSQQNNATWTVVLARSLARLPDTEIHVVTEVDDIPASKTVTADGVHIHFVRSPSRFKTLTFWQFDRLRLHRVLAEIDPDVVHGEGIENQYGYAAVTAGRPCLLTIHGIPKLVRSFYGGAWFDRQRLVELFEQYCLRHATNLVVINPFVADVYDLQANGQRLFPIPNAIALEFFETSVVAREDDLLLAIGTLEPRKGFDVFLAALAVLQRRGVTARVKIVGPVLSGGGSCHDQLRQFADANGLHVEFTGGLAPAAIADLLHRCCALVHPARHETAPMVVAEAMAAGTPVLASRVGGLPHMIDDGRSGLLFESENVDELAGKLEQLLRDPARGRALGKAAAEQARQTYHPSRVAELTRQAYATVLAAKSGR